MVYHVGRDVGVEVEARHQRNILADDAAHARQNFAFAVVEMLGDHRAVQVKIDRIERTGGRDAVDHDLHNAFERVPGDMRRRACTAGDRRNELPAIGFGAVDETGQADIDAAHHLQHAGALRHRRPAAAMLEVLKRRLRRSEGVGLVQEAAEGDTCHQLKSGPLNVRDVSLGPAARARCEAIRKRMGSRRFQNAAAAVRQNPPLSFRGAPSWREPGIHGATDSAVRWIPGPSLRDVPE